jgi:AcrR family transcriptional regulator
MALIEAAARLIGREGLAALTLRRLANDVGTSTMAVYTHFGGMPELRREVRREGFTRLAAHLRSVDATRDAVADVAHQGWEYYRNAVENPELFRVMFTGDPVDAADAAVGWDTFLLLVDGVQRCIDAGRFTDGDSHELARQHWVLVHGIAMLELAGIMSAEQAATALVELAGHLFVGLGDAPARTRRSLAPLRRRAGLA